MPRCPSVSNCQDSAGVALLHLATQRQNQGISLQTVAETTKISIRFLRAIEAEEFQKLPGGVFNSNYIRQYAAMTNAAESLILARHDEVMKALEQDIAPEPSRRTYQLLMTIRRVFGFSAGKEHSLRGPRVLH